MYWITFSSLSLLLLSSNFHLPAATKDDHITKADGNRCFCQLQGQIDDCTCNVDTVDHYNNYRIQPRLKNLLSKNYFRYFKVNLKRPCPFWAEDGRCSIKDCSVKACAEEQVPAGLKVPSHTNVNTRYMHEANKYKREAQDDQEVEEECEKEIELSQLDTKLSAESQQDFLRWKDHDDARDNFCDMDDEMSSDMQYVDLLLNPERYTGYKGESAHRIWKSIYDENCFQPRQVFGQYLTSEDVGGMCLEKRAFYRAVSGLHSSINIHLCARYLMGDKLGGFGGMSTWGRNLAEFNLRFDPDLTFGEGPSRLKNLYFLYLLELRALAKAAPYLEKESFYTGNQDDDEEVIHAVKDLLSIIKDFPEHFNETSMFTANEQAKNLKEEFRLHFRNISRIMDCVGCDKCRLWGKLQIQGLGTALKILFSGEQSGHEFSFSDMKKTKFQLTRQEIVALVNAFGRISNSIFELEHFRSIMPAG